MPPQTDRPGRRASLACPALLLAAAAVLAFLPALRAGFVYDDHLYLDENPAVAGGMSFAAARWAFTSFHAANWHPLTWLSHLFDVSLFGMEPRGHHAVNLALHALNAVVLFLVLRRATGGAGRSLFVAALFAVHPLHAETVVWVSERKDLLATLFWFLAIGSYLRQVRRPGAAAGAATAVLFALALLAKPMPVTLPALLLLLDVWPLGRVPVARGFTGIDPPRVAWRRALVGKLPLAALAAVSAAVTLAAQRAGGALQSLEGLPFAPRLANAPLAAVRYLGQCVWPADLAVFYAHPGAAVPWAPAAGAALLLAAVSALAVGARRRGPHLAVGWAWYLLTLLPVIGLVQVGVQSHADRYTYVPLVGIFIAATWGVAGAFPAGSRAARGLAPAAAALVLALGALSFRQAAVWRDDVTLFGHALAAAGDSWTVRSNLGASLSRQGRHEEAIPHLRAVVEQRPGYAPAWYNLATSQLGAGRPAEAVSGFRRALRLQPRYPEALFNLGDALVRLGRGAEAEAAFRGALEQRPGYPNALVGLGVTLAARGRHAEAVERYREALRERPRFPEASYALSLSLYRLGDRRGSVAALRETLRADPGHPAARQALRALGISVDILPPPP